MFEPERCILEVKGAAAGILVLEDNKYVFHAAADWAWPLDGARYADIRAAEHAIFALQQNHEAPDKRMKTAIDQSN